jgi:hypothetical protein
MSIDVRASGSAFELWHVQLPAGGVRTLSLDELDAAFQAGSVNERTMVLKAGAIHWTTLGEAAGIEEQPNSLAPFASDVASSSFAVPPSPLPPSNVSLTAELAALQPKRRGGRVFFAVAAIALVSAGSFGAMRSNVGGLGEKFAALTSGKQMESARAAAIAPASEPAKVTPPPAAVESLPTAKTEPSVSIDSLPSAPIEKADKKSKKAEPAPKKRAPAKAKAKGKASSTDPTFRGTSDLDPLNGNL